MASEIESSVNYNRWIFSKFKNCIGKNILEIGPGFGNLSNYISDFKTYVVLDIDENVINRAKEINNKRTYFVMDAASDDFSKELGNYSFDTVICVNVLEHIYDHDKAFRNMMDVLNTNGHLLLFVPAFNFLYNDMDKLAGHFRRYTKNLCKKLLKNGNYQLIKAEYFNPIGALGWWANKFVQHDDLDSKQINNQVRFFDKYVIHLSKSLNPLTKYFFGQSLVCVFKKNNKNYI